MCSLFQLTIEYKPKIFHDLQLKRYFNIQRVNTAIPRNCYNYTGDYVGVKYKAILRLRYD